jgi:hypothetical protein
MRNIIGFFCLFSSLFSDNIEDLKLKVADSLPEVWGWCSREKADNFIDLVLEVKPQVCAEIGVFGGASLLPVGCALKHLGQGVVIAIDPWDIIECIRYLDPNLNEKDIRWWVKINMDHTYYGFLNLLRQFDLERTCIVLKMTSTKAASLVGMIDILHIDGSHFESPALEDVRNYLPKVRSGGYIWLNDAASAALQPAANLLKEHCDQVKTIDNGKCILFRKKW